MDLIDRQKALDAVSCIGDENTITTIGHFVRILKALPSAQPEIKTDGDTISRQAAIDALSTCRGIIYPIRAIESLPSAQPKLKQNTHSERAEIDKLGVKTGKTCTDTISRQAAIDAVDSWLYDSTDNRSPSEVLKAVPSAQPEIIRCCKCVYWQQNTVRQNSNDAGWWNEALCEKHTIYGNEPHEAWVDADWYCADAERRTDERLDQQTGGD